MEKNLYKIFNDVPKFLSILGFKDCYHDKDLDQWVVEYLPSENLTHSNGTVVQGGFVSGMVDSAMSQFLIYLSKGKELYNIYCAVCHGSKGDGQGILMKREKFLGIPSYADREITEGSTYHVLMYGKNLMGSHASQVNAEERWQISQYVMSLREKLIK